jgi:hypothetical protein
VTSQVALPGDACRAVYATAGYGDSSDTLARMSLESDFEFRDGASLQMARASGGVAGGYTAALQVGIRSAGRAISARLQRSRR